MAVVFLCRRRRRCRFALSAMVLEANFEATCARYTCLGHNHIAVTVSPVCGPGGMNNRLLLLSFLRSLAPKIFF